MNEEIIKNIALELNLKDSQVRRTMELLETGSTIPFIARYRKEVTGALNEDELRKIEDTYKYNLNLVERKESVIKLIDEKGMLTEEIKNAIINAKKLSEVESIYLPFKEQKKTKGTEAIKLGLEPLANIILSLSNENREEVAKSFINDKVKTIEDAITNAGYIIADKINNNPTYRKWIREYMIKTGVIKTKIKKNAIDEKKTYEIYYAFDAKIPSIKMHQVFAISRAEKEKVISYDIEVTEGKIFDYLEEMIIKNKETTFKEDICLFIKDTYKRLLFPSLEREIKSDLFAKASEQGIKEFGNNLENLLMTPPITESVVLGFDPAFRTGCKLAVLNPQGEVLEIGVIYPHEPHKKVEEATKKILELINKYQINIIAIGNGTASRESESFVSQLINDNHLSTKYIIVSEAGASVYSASPLAKKEFPDYSVEQRSAVSIGRRLQDALSELVKIDPKSIGVGLYQHDIKGTSLDDKLSFVVLKIVNKVGVNINNASESILGYISGLNKKAIKSLLEYRKKTGKIKSREELKKVRNIDDKVFEQSAGFLRILEGNNPLDKTNIHPEDYELVNRMLNDYQIDVNLIGTEEIKNKLVHVKNNYNISGDKFYTIKENLKEGVIDPRKELRQVELKSHILTIEDLEIGMKIDGTVRNVTSFGAFVDIGLHSDALIHISKLSKLFVKDPNEILKAGDIITCTVISIDIEKERVNLSLIEES